MTTESPSALFTLSSIPVTPARSLPRIPGQQGVLVQLSPVMVPSTNVVCRIREETEDQSEGLP